MPLKYPCPGRCGQLTDGGRCPACQQAQYRDQDARRGKTAARGYDAVWRKLRAVKIATDPICEIQTHCHDGLAEEVDHVIPIREKPELRLVWSNLQSSCKPCHSAKTERENRVVSGRSGAQNQGDLRVTSGVIIPGARVAE